ncbi:MAG: DUF1707 domain-containing protein [Solirubrobacteraceae bacterium]
MSKRGSLRASDNDRDQIVDRLRKAATEGRIAAEELEHRVTKALRARTYDELDETVSDLPRPGGRGTAQRGRSARGWAVATVRENPMLLLVAIPVLAVTVAMLLAATIVWTILMIVFLVLGGRRRVPRGLWTYAWRADMERYRHRPRGRRGPGSYWA